MSRRRFLRRCLQGACLPMLGPLSAFAAPIRHPAGRPFHVLMITFRGETDVDRGFRAYLADAGLDVRFTVRDVQQDVSRVPAILDEAKALAPDLIYAWGTPVTLAVVGPHDAPGARHHVHDIPVVFALVAAPVQSRIVQSLEAPGRNVTGAVHVVPPEVQLRVMQNYRPFRRLGVLYNSAEPNSRAIVAQARAFCERQGAELVARTFRTGGQGQPVGDGVEDLVAQIHAAGAEWLYLLPDTFLGTLFGRIAPVALQLGLPSFGAAELAVRSGGALLGLVSRYYSVGQLAGAKAVDILAGGKPAGALPVETLKRFSLLVNMRVAHSLRLYPPIDMLNYAEVIAVGDAPAFPS
ncbi:MAG: ABC transporter substrate-binding protein [Rhodocyclaceae bacterium]|nr:ABC transporter substrate-binding protein [Rhodocyclaceae bacterium]